MRRSTAVPPLLCALLVGLLPGAPEAALVTDVADAADGDNPLDVNIDFRWTRWQRRGLITRETISEGTTINASELRYSRWTQVLDTQLTVGLYKDLEIRGRVPYAVQDLQSWGFARPDGVSVRPNSTIANNPYDADGRPLAGDTTQALFPVPGQVQRGAWLDPSIGLSWAVFNDQRTPRLPGEIYPYKARSATLVLGFDYTMPIIDPMDPTRADPTSGVRDPRLTLGTGAHRFDWWMAMSKRVGMVEPYLKMHYMLPVASARAFDNCRLAADDPNHFKMTRNGQALCRSNSPNWAGETGLQPPHVGGILVGTEIIPIEEPNDGIRLSIGLQFAADYISRGRTYSELSDALGKLTYTDQYFALDGRLTFDLRLSKWVHFVTFLSLGTDTPHFLTSEPVGKDLTGNGEVRLPADGEVSEEMNPNYDLRLDQPGRRLAITEVSVFAISTMLSINF